MVEALRRGRRRFWIQGFSDIQDLYIMTILNMQKSLQRTSIGSEKYLEEELASINKQIDELKCKDN